ncbi:unknown [Gryllus bimaculatus nudivirus]|uniref:Uncharacterized protein n=1 Tax=Gryllus bimaculatus nudivirus TaxID=432587 RepID=A4L1Z7_9VIRU|nr:hypothetical protein GrBNV_gp34 [Gryllus bimaculatus nudivirus]ABO45367.1 unknown [Gryllus bimaculatus nudivirus]
MTDFQASTSSLKNAVSSIYENEEEESSHQDNKRFKMDDGEEEFNFKKHFRINKCTYNTDSRRNIKPKLWSSLNELNNYNNYKEICIDGPCGIGKTTLCQSMNRIYFKINITHKCVTQGLLYNIDPYRVLEYIINSLTINVPKILGNDDFYIVRDRCPYSNLIFYYIHYLCAKKINLNSKEKVFDCLDELSKRIAIHETVAYCRTIKDVPTIFIVNSNIQLVTLILRKRNDGSDRINSFNTQYIQAQYLVYLYWGKLLNVPILDVAVLSSNFKYTIKDVQNSIRNKIDVHRKQNCENFMELYTKFYEENYKEHEEFFNILDNLPNNLMFYESKK